MPSYKYFFKKLRICLKQMGKNVKSHSINSLSKETEVIKSQVENLELNNKIWNWEKKRNSMYGFKRIEMREEKASEGGDRTI